MKRNYNSAQNKNGMTRKTPPHSLFIFVTHMVTPPSLFIFVTKKNYLLKN